MRHIIQTSDGKFIALQTKPGLSGSGRYAIRVPDAKDAHDFGSSAAAQEWMRTQRVSGTVRQLGDDGYWPPEPD